MTVEPRPSYEYQVGGSLPVNAPTYVWRQADREFYDSLKRGDFCYVLNSRQMGKSSLRVQTMQRLQREGFACADIDITAIGTADITPTEWYAGVIDTLVGRFNLYHKFDLETWWNENSLLSPVQHFSKFIETVLLKEKTENIVIFIDEIDSILSIKFPLDDFFAVIRECYNRRSDHKEYHRLTFALIGVSTPTDLISDKGRTPFNIGRAIDLTGFQLEEAQPLAQGLEAVGDRTKLMTAILDWTGGQPFLTQKVCKLVLNAGQEQETKADANIAQWVEELVRSQIITNWEAHDEPTHLKTIRDRILRSQHGSGRLLGLCQQILQQGEVITDESPEQVELRLTGLVVKRDGKLRIYNRLYAEVFNKEWCDGELAKIRPYTKELNDWVASERQDESRLLRGKALEDAQTWAKGKSLSDLDYQFLAASQELENREIQKLLDVQTAKAAAAKAEIEASQAIQQAKQKIEEQKRKTRDAVLITSLGFLTIITIFAGLKWREAEAGQIQKLTAFSSFKYTINRNTFDALIDALRAAKQLKQSMWYGNDLELQAQVMEALGSAVYSVRESDRLEGHQNFVMQATFSPDGKTIATASYDNTAKLWNSDGKQTSNLQHNDSVTDVSFSPDNQIIATPSLDGTVKLWNQQGKLLRNLTAHKDKVWSVRFSPDGKTIATASEDNTVKLWSLDGKLIKTLNGHTIAVYKVAFSRDGKIATASEDNTVKLWDTQGNLINTLKGHTDAVLSVNFSPDGQTLASASKDKTVILWDVKKSKQVTSPLIHTDIVRDVIFSPDGQIIATASDDNVVKLWRNQDYLLLETLNGHQGSVNSVSFNPQGNILASSSVDKTVKLWRINDLLTTLKGHSEGIYSVDISPKGNMIATAGSDNTVKLWNLQGKQLKTLQGHTQSIGSLNFSPDGELIVSGSNDKTVRRWNLQGQQIKPHLTGHSRVITSVAWSPNNNIIASASLDSTVKLWSRKGEFIKNLENNDEQTGSLSFSPNGKIIAAASRYTGRVQLWDSDGNSLRNWQAHNTSIYNIRFSPNSKFIATASEDNTVKLWNLDGSYINSLKGHTAGIWGLDFSPDGRMIATASDDKTVKIWSDRSVLIMTLNAHLDSVNSLKFSPDSKILATASSDKTAMLWHIENLNLDTFMVRGCNWLSDYLKNNRNAPNDICNEIKR
ncbi:MULTISPECIES: WD40 domain-containing protein [Calothrix]|uniref:AAA-like domain-containing protein n=2 Tax=Calothrix TaxID=1186 RepID=A0ABR8AHC1_9CYAN|nr:MULTISPECIES: AAA-like domain-containing protein [Calothrix]MBD2199452.1 AAA-like domain-containing protein [Calothrix parietina FACHB-288]MBD2228260.1 AAA-like domain-containing protein [Calothrix anomala FACHB-343]